MHQKNAPLKPLIRVSNPSVRGFFTSTMAFVCIEMPIFATDMKPFAIHTLYWATSLLLLAVIICSTGYRFPEALMLSTSLLPFAMLLRQMIARVSFTANRHKAVKSLLFILLFTLTMALLAIHLAHTAIRYIYHQIPTLGHGIPPMLLNPVFLLSMLVLLTTGDYGLGRLLRRRLPEADETITFISDRQSTTLMRSEILYVESCDTEVWIHATDDRRFRNKTAISSWANLLGPEYLRIHRSYLVRLSACTGMDRDHVLLGDVRLPVSRKYKATVQQSLKAISTYQ